MIINDAISYELDTATANDAQYDTSRDLKTVTHSSNENEKVTDTINGNSEQKLLSNRTLLVVTMMMNPRIDLQIAPIEVAPHTLLTPATK